MGLPRIIFALACLGAAMLLSGCFLKPEHEEGEPLREGLDVRVGGIDYNVYITRELNLELPDDRGYWKGKEAPPGFSLYGVFLQACNRSDQDPDLEDAAYETTEHFKVVDTQGNEYEPLEPEADNQFQYHAEELEPGECVPAVGSLAQQGPTAGAMLAFQFPLAAGENRPLELEILGEHDPIAGEFEKAAVELDL
jgi:hypothetical protein